MWIWVNPESQGLMSGGLRWCMRTGVFICVSAAWAHGCFSTCLCVTRERRVTSVMPEALSTEGGRVKRSTQGKRPSSCKSMSHHRKWKPAEGPEQICTPPRTPPHPLRGPPPTGTNTSLSPSSLSLLLSSKPPWLSLRGKIKSSHPHTHTVAGRGALAPLTSVF